MLQVGQTAAPLREPGRVLRPSSQYADEVGAANTVSQIECHIRRMRLRRRGDAGLAVTMEGLGGRANGPRVGYRVAIRDPRGGGASTNSPPRSSSGDGGPTGESRAADQDVHDVIQPTETEGMDLLPANIDLSAAEVQLVSEVAREQTLKRVIDRIRGEYDMILIDCAPSLGLLTINALTASDYVIMPLECEFFALRGIALLTDTIEKVQDRLNPDLEILGILGTMFDPRTLHAREVMERVVQAFGDTVFHTVIKRTIKFPETTVAGEPITSYASSSPGAQAYRDLAKEVLARCRAE